MARKAVKHSTLEVRSMSIKNPAPNNIELSFKQVFYSNSSYSTTLYPFNASFYLLDNASNPPFASIQAPKVVASNGTEAIVEPQRVNITHMDEFTRYILLALASKEFAVALRGEGALKQGILPKTSVSYDKNIMLKGRCIPINFVVYYMLITNFRL